MGRTSLCLPKRVQVFSSEHMNTDLQALSFPQSEGKIPKRLGSVGWLGSVYTTFTKALSDVNSRRGLKPHLVCTRPE